MPETDESLDKICELIGVERVPRKYDRENGICCAAPFGMRGHQKEVRKTQNANVQDMVLKLLSLTVQCVRIHLKEK